MIIRILLAASVLFVIYFSACSISPPRAHSADLTIDDIAFCYERELWDILAEYEEEIRRHVANTPHEPLLYEVLESIAISEKDTLKYIEVLDAKVLNLQQMNDAFRVLNLLKNYSQPLMDEKLPVYKKLFNTQAQRSMLKRYADIITEEEMLSEVSLLEDYPPEFENYIRRYIDEVAVERNDSLRIESCLRFAEDYPASEWQDLNKYLMTVSLLNQEEYDQVISIIKDTEQPSAALAHLFSSILQTPALRKNYEEGAANGELLGLSLQISRDSAFPKDRNTIKVIYNNWDKEYWHNKSNLLEAKAIYFDLIHLSAGYWGDEELIAALDDYSQDMLNEARNLLQDLSYPNNDYGEIAELRYWQGRIAILSDNIDAVQTSEYFIDALIAGAPRKRFDESAFGYLTYIYEQQDIETDIMEWVRAIKNYQGPVFQDITESAGLASVRTSRVAVADYDNDGFADILGNGRLLFRNNADMTFSNITEEAGIKNFGFVGGLWADYDQDGNIDFAAFSRNLEGEGNKLYRNNGNGTFSIDEDSDINDQSPTEGAAWIDIDQKGYPSLYLANYERWQVQSGFEDYFMYNDRGLFLDKSEEFGFKEPAYTKDPGLAGRGVSPADYNNDGIQSIFVSNYRLTRNFLWDNVNGQFVDNAALNGVRGHLQRGYYGHTIGADWGDYNNSGRLDLFLCNLAHPRFLEFSDISMLLRNDGPMERQIGKKTVHYHRFTDVTQEAGITFDELHSDPNWFDTNNNGYLDLYMTSIYENDRSYLYLNNGDGTFTDITFLSGTRVYNGWGNATADFNNNGKLDMIVGSGSGVRLFENVTPTEYNSISFKPYWDSNEIKIVNKNDWNQDIPNSPAFGTRVQATIRFPDGNEKTLIRELNGGKGTTSQNDQFLHFGLKNGELIEADIWKP